MTTVEMRMLLANSKIQMQHLLALSLGVMLLRFIQVTSFPTGCLFLCAGAGVGLFVLFPCLRRLLIILTLVLVGNTWASVDLVFHQRDILPKALEGRSVLVKGYVANIPQRHGLQQRFNFRLATLDGQKNSGIIQLSWYGHHNKTLAVGDYWEFQVRLKRPHGFANGAGFNQEQWLFVQHVLGTGYVLARGIQRRLDSHWYHDPIQRLRSAIIALFKECLKGSSVSGVLLALVIGYKGMISQHQWQLFRSTGTSHLMAISGLHVGLIAGATYKLAQFIWARIPRASLWQPAPKVAALVALLAIFWYALLSGMAIPTQRALLMISTVLLARIQTRHLPLGPNLVYALFFVLLLDPLASLQAGFWLSFSAVIWIGYVSANRVGYVGQMKQAARVQLAVTMGLMPVSLWFFHAVSFVSIFANALAIPLVASVVVPISVLATCCLPVKAVASLLLHVAAACMTLVLQYLQWLSTWPFAVWQYSIHSLFLLSLALLGSFLLLMPRGVPGRFLSLILCLPLFFCRVASPKQGEIWCDVFDVGQGLATMIRTQHHVLIYDTGPRFSRHFDAGSAVLLPALQREGVRHVDMVIISHGDNDHIGGMQSLSERYPPGVVLTSVPDKLTAWRARACVPGTQWRWDGVSFRILWPAPTTRLQGNNRSCVLRVSNGIHSLLIPGDIEAPAEKALVATCSDCLQADVLVAPHHGSRSSSTPAFIQQVKPDYVIFSTGYRNRYHFPALSLVKRLDQLGVRTLNTAICGKISIKFAQNITITPYRQRHSEWW